MWCIVFITTLSAGAVPTAAPTMTDMMGGWVRTDLGLRPILLHLLRATSAKDPRFFDDPGKQNRFSLQ